MRQRSAKSVHALLRDGGGTGLDEVDAASQLRQTVAAEAQTHVDSRRNEERGHLTHGAVECPKECVEVAHAVEQHQTATNHPDGPHL